MKYTITGYFYLMLCLFRTHLFFRPARLIRFPIDVRNKNAIFWGRLLTTGRNCRIEAIDPPKSEKTIVFGERVQINDAVHIVGKKRVVIGNDVLIASKVFISDCSHGLYDGDGSSSPDIPPRDRGLTCCEVNIGARVWLGDNVVVMPGVSIGDGSIIGASSVVTKNVPSNCIAVGNPARVVKQYDPIKAQWIRV